MVNRLHFTLLMGPTLPLPAPAEVTNSVNSVQVTVSADQRSGFQVVFAISRKSLLMTTLIAAGYFDVNRRVILIATVNGMPDVLMDGIVTRQEVGPSNEPGQSTLTITGEDVSVAMSLQEVKGMPFPAMSAELRVGALLAKYLRFGLIPLVVPSLFPELPIPIREIPFQEGTDLDYITKLAQENGYVFYIEPGPVPGANTAYWGPEIRIGVPQPALNIGMDAHTNVESLNFSYDGSSREQLAIAIQEPLTKLTIPIPLPEISILSPPLALIPPPALKYKFLEGSAKLNPIKAIAKGLGQVSKSADAVTGSGQLDVLRYGRVLKARRLVGVRGAGLAYDGLYFVKSVTHNLNLKKGEFKQSFQLARNGLVSLTPAVVP